MPRQVGWREGDEARIPAQAVWLESFGVSSELLLMLIHNHSSMGLSGQAKESAENHTVN
jgi:hypothetical protein